MLARCLSAVAYLKIPPEVDCTVFVVGNEPEQESRVIAERYGARYAHEPQLGVPFARNAAVEAALAWNADFIAFLDDDAWPDSEWLGRLYAMQRLTGAAAIRGRQVLIYPEPMPEWVFKRPRKTSEGRNPWPVRPRAIGCNNVLIDADYFLFGGLRFDPRFRFTTGEDTALMTAIEDQGGKLFATSSAIVFEAVMPERTTFRRHLARQYAYAAGNTLIERDHGRYASVLFEAAWAAIQAVGALASAIIIGGLTLSKRRFKKRFLRAGQKAAYAAGVFASLAGRMPEPYSVVDGY